MKKFTRFTSLCLAFLMVLAVFPFQATAAVSIPSNLKSVVFDAAYYAGKYADLKAAFGTDATRLYNHFVNSGIKEGRQASPMFSVDYYLTKNGDLKAAFGSNRESAMNHFLAHGINESRITAPYVDLGTDIDVRISMNSGGMNLGYTDTNVCTVTPVLEGEQYWTLARQSDGSYKITNKATGKVLDVYAASRASGANVDLYASNNTNAQRWFIYKHTNGTYVLRAKSGTTCALSVNGNSTAAGANVQMNTYSGAAGQQFKISQASALEKMTPVNLGSNFWANIKGVGSNYNLAVSGETALIRYPNKGDGQAWRFIRFSDGSYEITNLKTGRSLDCAAGKGTNGTVVQTYLSNNSNAQRWYIYSVNGNYVLAPKCSLTCALAVAGGGTTSGTTMQLSTYSASSTAQQFIITKFSKEDSEKNLSISEICATPGNGAYEFMEIMNTSDTAVNINKYSLYRFSASNSGKYEFSAYRKVLGLVSPTGSDTALTSLDRLNLSKYNAEIAPGQIAVLWFVSYANRNLTVDDFKAYWTSQGNDMTNVVVVPVAIHNGSADVYAATSVNTGAGKGFLPDYKVASAFSLIKNETVNNTRLDNGTELKNLKASADAPLAYTSVAELQKRADSIALHFVSTTAETGSSRNFYNFVDEANHIDKAKAKVQKFFLDYEYTYIAPTYPAQVMGTNGSDGRPSAIGEYINYSSNVINSITLGVDCGTKNATPTPGAKVNGQFHDLDLVSTTVDEAGNVTFTGSFKYDEYSKAGFVITTLHTENGVTVAKKTVNTTTFTKTADGYTYSIKVSGLPVNDGTVVLNVVPYALSAATGARVNGVREQIKCPIVSAVINGVDISTLKVTYLANEKDAPIGDIAGITQAVKLLANDIEYYTGVEIEIAEYNPRADYPQIVIASSGSGAGGNSLVPNNKTVGADQYGLFFKNGDIFAIGGSAIAAEYASQQIARALADASGKIDFKDLCSDSVKNFSTKTNKLALTDGADYRFVSHNVERFELNKDTSRINNFVETIRYYNADVIGFQEYCATFTSLLTPKLASEGYTVIGNDVSGGKQNYAPLAYKTSRFTCVEKGWFVLSGETNYPGHNVTWAVLKDKKTGEIFATSTTHFYHKSDRSVANPVRAINAQEIVDLTKRIDKKYGCEVINMGDYNTYSFDAAYSVFVNSGIVTDCRYDAIRGYSPERTSHYSGVSSPRAGSEALGIDTFMQTSGVTVLRHRMPTNKTTSGAADHFPICIDISLAK